MSVGHLPSMLDKLLPGLDPMHGMRLGEAEVVIHAPGFEDRTTSVSEGVTTVPGTRAILVDYRPLRSDNRLKEVRDRLRERGIMVADDDILEYNRFEPGDFEDRLQTRLGARKERRVNVDISTMSKLLIMLILGVCHRSSLPVRIVYSEAQEYGPSEHEFEVAKKGNKIHRPSLQASTGVYGVVRVDSLASVAMQGQPSAALVFMSFNDALTQVLLNTVYPARLFLINGRPPRQAWREAATAWIHEEVRREWEKDNPASRTDESGIPLPDRVASTLEYRETASLLLQLYWELADTHRILLAPAGSKMQAVGCYLAKALHQDIHIEYPSSNGFSPTYSSGLGNRWLLDLGLISERLVAISAAERRAFLEIHT